MSATKQSTRLRKVECDLCGCICRMSRAAMSRCGVPLCGCGNGPMTVSDLEDAVAVLAPEVLSRHPEYVRLGEVELRRAVREAAGGAGSRLHCGGCHAFIPATNHDCSCGFANDVRGRRNHGRWVEGASSCAAGRAAEAERARINREMPF